jgi:hypothetical protein
MTTVTSPVRRRPLSQDARRVLRAQALRAFAYGLGAVLLGNGIVGRRTRMTSIGRRMLC